MPVYGVVERRPRPFARYGTPETLRAAATLWTRGADRLYNFNFYNTAEYPLRDELSDPAEFAHLPKEYFLDACSMTNNATVRATPLPLALMPIVTVFVQLLICDNPATAEETSLEIIFKSEGEPEAPAITPNGQTLHGLKSIRGKSDTPSRFHRPL